MHNAEIYLYMCAVYVCAEAPWRVCGDEGTACESRFSPPTLWASEIKLSSLGLAAHLAGPQQGF